MTTSAWTAGPRIGGDQNYPVLRHALVLGPAGTAVEFGVGEGASLRIIAEHMPVVGFDSFQGLPEDWRAGYPKGALANPRPPAVANARIVIGWFADTLPGFDFAALGPIGLVHVDCDLYSSTAAALKYVGPHLRPGTLVVFDEFREYPGCEDHEQRAWREYVADGQTRWQVIGHKGQEWAIRIV